MNWFESNELEENVTWITKDDEGEPHEISLQWQYDH